MCMANPTLRHAPAAEPWRARCRAIPDATFRTWLHRVAMAIDVNLVSRCCRRAQRATGSSACHRAPPLVANHRPARRDQSAHDAAIIATGPSGARLMAPQPHCTGPLPFRIAWMALPAHRADGMLNRATPVRVLTCSPSPWLRGAHLKYADILPSATSPTPTKPCATTGTNCRWDYFVGQARTEEPGLA